MHHLIELVIIFQGLLLESLKLQDLENDLYSSTVVADSKLFSNLNTNITKGVTSSHNEHTIPMTYYISFQVKNANHIDQC